MQRTIGNGFSIGIIIHPSTIPTIFRTASLSAPPSIGRLICWRSVLGPRLPCQTPSPSTPVLSASAAGARRCFQISLRCRIPRGSARVSNGPTDRRRATVHILRPPPLGQRHRPDAPPPPAPPRALTSHRRQRRGASCDTRPSGSTRRGAGPRGGKLRHLVERRRRRCVTSGDASA